MGFKALVYWGVRISGLGMYGVGGLRVSDVLKFSVLNFGFLG